MRLSSLFSICLSMSLGWACSLPASPTFRTPVPDPVSLYLDAVATGDPFIVLLGEIRRSDDPAGWDANRFWEDGDMDLSYTTSFDGFRLTPDGFTEPFSADLRMRELCEDYVCGGLNTRGDTLLFVFWTGEDTLSATAGLNGHWAGVIFEPEDIERLVACRRGQCPLPR